SGWHYYFDLIYINIGSYIKGAGGIYRYDSVAAMATQTNSVASGTLVATVADYGTDQGTTMDLSTGTIYRINGAGDIISYAGLSAYLGNSGGQTVASGIYSGNDSLNGFSYDGATGGFYAIGGGGATNNAQGDLIRWANLSDLLANTNRTITVASFNGNLFNFYDPDGIVGTTYGATGFPATSRTTHYYQSSGAGRLEGWETLAMYTSPANEQGNKRVHYTAENVYGGTSTAYGSNLIDAATVFAIPETGTAALALAGGLVALGRRRRTA
ncbi:MAG: hypothetical protein EOP85_22910, partial [Verrucomicrobiaceae bacterium]